VSRVYEDSDFEDQVSEVLRALAAASPSALASRNSSSTSSTACDSRTASAGGGRERGEPDDARLSRGLAGISQEVTRFFRLKAWLGGVAVGAGLVGIAIREALAGVDCRGTLELCFPSAVRRKDVAPAMTSLREPGAIPAAVVLRARPSAARSCLATSVSRARRLRTEHDRPCSGALDEAKVRRARPRGDRRADAYGVAPGRARRERIRQINSMCRLVCHGLYAALNAEHLLGACADEVLGGGVRRGARRAGRAARRGEEPSTRPRLTLERLSFPVPRRHGLPALTRYATLSRDGRRIPAGYVEASRGCLHTCLHCPIPPVVRRVGFFAVPRDVVLEDVRRLVADGAGARHVRRS